MEILCHRFDMAGTVGDQEHVRDLAEFWAEAARPLGSDSTVPRQNPISQCALVKLGLLGPQQGAHPVPLLQQSQCLLEKLGLLESQTRVPRRNLNSHSSGGAGPLWFRANGTNSATAASKVREVQRHRIQTRTLRVF